MMNDENVRGSSHQPAIFLLAPAGVKKRCVVGSFFACDIL